MVEFVVRPPHDTPRGSRLFLAGDAVALGRWRADAVPLDPWGDGTHRGRVDLPEDAPFRFNVTRGRWRDAEGDGRGGDAHTRESVARPGLVVDVNVAGWGRGSVEYHYDWRSHVLPHARPVSVFLPPGYKSHLDHHYPVLYMHDGQNLFDAHTAFGGNPWKADETAEGLARCGDIRPLIIVGVGNTPDRLNEYGPRRTRPGLPNMARKYAEFLTAELKPFIDRSYRTRPGPADTGVCGSSMGGLISLHLTKWHPDVFGRCGAMSPSLWWDKEKFIRTLPARAGWTKKTRLWLCMGGREGYTEAGRQGNLRRARDLAEGYRKLGRVEGVEFAFHEQADGEHNEGSWGRRFDRVLKFLFPAGEGP